MAIRDEVTSGRLTPLANPQAVGRERVFRSERSGEMFLRINEPAGQRADNAGQLSVRIERLEANTATGPADQTD